MIFKYYHHRFVATLSSLGDAELLTGHQVNAYNKSKNGISVTVEIQTTL